MLAPIPWSFRRRHDQAPADAVKSGAHARANRAARLED